VCPGKCGIYRFIEAPTAEAALEALKTLGWTDVCVKCSQTRAQKVAAAAVPVFLALVSWGLAIQWGCL
jgi:hypothetical protein